MRVVRRDNQTLTGEILDNVLPGSHLCTDGWAAYNGLKELQKDNLPVFRSHQVVIHSENFMNPPRGEEPFWRSDLLPECIDSKFIGPYKFDCVKGKLMYPYRVHTQKVERSWLELRKSVKSTRTFELIDRYIGKSIDYHRQSSYFDEKLL